MESKIQATHAEHEKPHVEEKNNLSLNITFILKAVNMLEATLTLRYGLDELGFAVLVNLYTKISWVHLQIHLNDFNPLSAY